jgi:hypothetical protein
MADRINLTCLSVVRILKILVVQSIEILLHKFDRAGSWQLDTADFRSSDNQSLELVWTWANSSDV